MFLRILFVYLFVFLTANARDIEVKRISLEECNEELGVSYTIAEKAGADGLKQITIIAEKSLNPFFAISYKGKIIARGCFIKSSLSNLLPPELAKEGKDRFLMSIRNEPLYECEISFLRKGVLYVIPVKAKQTQ